MVRPTHLLVQRERDAVGALVEQWQQLPISATMAGARAAAQRLLERARRELSGIRVKCNPARSRRSSSMSATEVTPARAVRREAQRVVEMQQPPRASPSFSSCGPAAGIARPPPASGRTSSQTCRRPPPPAQSRPGTPAATARVRGTGPTPAAPAARAPSPAGATGWPYRMLRRTMSVATRSSCIEQPAGRNGKPCSICFSTSVRVAPVIAR